MCVSNCDVKCIFYHLLKNRNTESFTHHNYFAFCLFCLEDLLHIILFFVSSTNSNSLFKTQLLWSLNQSFTICSFQFSSVTQSCPTLCNPMNHSMPGLPIHHQLLESTQTHVHLVSDAIQPSNPQSYPSPPAPIPPSIRVFSNESTLRMRWPKYWSFIFSISPCNEHPGLISFRMDWLDLLAVQGTLKSLLQHQFFSARLSSQSNSHIHMWPLEKP